MNRSALVTGASRGIGRAVAVELGRRGYRLALTARAESDLADTVQQVRQAGGEAHHHAVDATNAIGFLAAVDHSLGWLGGSLDLLVNNAGSALRRAPLQDLTDGDWQASLDLNLMAAVRASRTSFPALKEAGGCIVNVSSVVADRASVTGGAYVAAKAALDALTRSTALEWARHGIRCVSVAPGYVDTDFNAEMVERGLTDGFLRKVPIRSAIAATEVARLIADLADPSHRHLTGSVVAVDGGLSVTL